MGRWFFLVSFWLCSTSVLWAADQVVLLLSADLKPYLEFAEGFRLLYPELHLFVLPEDEALARHFLEKHRTLPVVAVGSRALGFLRPMSPRRVFYALVVTREDAHRLLPGARLCGLFLRLPPELMLTRLKEVLHQVWPEFLEQTPTILLPFSSVDNAPYVARVREVARDLGFRLQEARVERVRGLKHLVEEEEFDLLLCIPDPLFATEEVISYVLRTCLWRHRPAVGYNRFFYEKGALISFVFDYRRLGQETARLLEAETCTERPAPFAVLVNEKVLKFLRQREGDHEAQP